MFLWSHIKLPRRTLCVRFTISQRWVVYPTAADNYFALKTE